MKLHIKIFFLNRNLQCLNNTVKGHVKAAEIYPQKNFFMYVVADYTLTTGPETFSKMSVSMGPIFETDIDWRKFEWISNEFVFAICIMYKLWKITVKC